jgi:hypothetical protein
VTPATMELAAEPGALRQDGSDGRQGPSGSTLEDLVLGAWEDLGARGRARCPVCGDRLEPAACAACGSSLA